MITVTDAEDNIEQVPAVGLDVQVAAELVERAKEQGVSLVGPGGLLALAVRSLLLHAGVTGFGSFDGRQVWC
jgi:hypothetical protein